MIYRSLAEFRAACDEMRADGREPPAVTLDNDSTYAYLGDECLFGGLEEHELLKQALDLLGIPHEEA